MNPRHLLLVRESWAELAPQADAVAALFYHRLREIEPARGTLFARSDPVSLRRKFHLMLAALLDLIDSPDGFVSSAVALGRRHATYGVEQRDYDNAGAALVWAISEALGKRATAELAEAWREFFVLVGALMRRGCAAPADADLLEHSPQVENRSG
ncbi:MAG TPA: globin domain-containing protein [Gemmatimonadaceae bacterium]|nr:globin domain-containing protein [Gemmatimonadaceae bacterium]